MSLNHHILRDFWLQSLQQVASWSRERCILRHCWNTFLLARIHERSHGCEEISTTPTPAMIFPSEFVLDAPSKNSCHTYSSEEVLIKLISVISSWEIFIKFWRSWDWMIGQKICHNLTFDRLLWHELHLIFWNAIRTRPNYWECMRYHVIMWENEYYPHTCDDISLRTYSWCTVKE